MASAKEEAAQREEHYALQLDEKAALVAQLRERLESCRCSSLSALLFVKQAFVSSVGSWIA